MKKLVLVVAILIISSMLLGACNNQPTVTPSTMVPTATIVPTITKTSIVPLTATPEDEDFVWTCENDPIKGITLDLGGMYELNLENRYVPQCGEFGWPIPLNEERYKIIFLRKFFKAVSQDNSFVQPTEATVSKEIYAEDYLVQHPTQKKGDIITFVMPASGFILPDRNGYSFIGVSFDDPKFEDNVKIHINGEEWFASGGILLSQDGEYIVPKGATVKIEALKDGDKDFNFGTIAWIKAIVFERTYPTETVKTNHPDINESTQIDFGTYGIFKPTFNGNKWVFSLSEEAMVKPRIWENASLRDFLWMGGAFVFRMPSDGVVFWNTKNISQNFYNNQTGSDNEDGIGARLFRKGTWVVLYFYGASLDDFYIEFLN